MAKIALIAQQCLDKYKSEGEVVVQIRGNGCCVRMTRPQLLQAVRHIRVYFGCRLTYAFQFLRNCVLISHFVGFCPCFQSASIVISFWILSALML